MTLQNFITRLNWLQILIHLVAFWFFIHAFQTLSYLYDTKLVDTVRHSNDQTIDGAFRHNGIEGSDLTYFILWTSVSGLIGLLIAFIISLSISIRRHWFWINSLIAFVLTYFLYKFDLLAWTYLKKIFWYLGQRVNNSTTEFLLNGIILLIIGFLIFFLPGLNKIIENKKIAAT
jgi:hypothetical protein